MVNKEDAWEEVVKGCKTMVDAGVGKDNGEIANNDNEQRVGGVSNVAKRRTRPT